jgi:hypothetical protein
MKKVTAGLLAILALILAAGAFSVQAAPITPTPAPVQPSFHDGRLNAYDPGAPVAIFETRQTVPIVDSNGLSTTGDVVCGVQLLYWNGSSAQQVLFVSTDQITTAINRFAGNSNSNSNNGNTGNTASNNSSVSNSTNNSNSANGTNGANNSSNSTNNNAKCNNNTTTSNGTSTFSGTNSNSTSNSTSTNNSSSNGNGNSNTTTNSNNNGTTTSGNTSNSNTNNNGNSTASGNSNNSSNNVTSNNKNGPSSETVGTIAGDSILVAASNGYKLYYSKSGYLWISTPPNFEGKVYTFSWQKDF